MWNIHEFTVQRKNKRFIVRDTDLFNNWGKRKFDTFDAAKRYAIWAHAFKTGKTFSPWLD